MITVNYTYYFDTTAGRIFIVPTNDGRFQVEYQGEGLGSYHNPSAAIDDVAGGHTFWPSNGIDFGNLGIPSSINEWHRLITR
jgi:hypothetical protein